MRLNITAKFTQLYNKTLNQEISESKIDVSKLYNVLKVVIGDQEQQSNFENANIKDRFLQVMGLPEELVAW